jgi:hypothetical protein
VLKSSLNGGSLPTASSSESELLYDWRFTANQFFLATNPLRLTTSNFIFQLNTCGYSPYVTSSLMRGWVYSCCWASPAQSFSGPSPTGLMTTFYCLRFETPPTWRTRPRIYIPRYRMALLYPQILCSLFIALPLLASIVLLRRPLHGPTRKHRFKQYLYCCIRIHCRGNMFTEPLARNGCTRYNILIIVKISQHEIRNDRGVRAFTYVITKEPV